MGFFTKLFKSNREGFLDSYLEKYKKIEKSPRQRAAEEGFIKSYLEIYKKIKNSPQYQVAAEGFAEESKMPKEFHYVNTAIAARRYKQDKQNVLLEYFMGEVKKYIERNNYLSERQMLICLLTMAYQAETYDIPDLKFESIANEYITNYFDHHELSDRIDIQKLKLLIKGWEQ